VEQAADSRSVPKPARLRKSADRLLNITSENRSRI
jgi:hypothetical protein